jgi:hypothetical protein
MSIAPKCHRFSNEAAHACHSKRLPWRNRVVKAEGICYYAASSLNESFVFWRQFAMAFRIGKSSLDASVDLVYRDSPFNSNADYNFIFREPSGQGSQAQFHAFTDTWSWTDAAETSHKFILTVEGLVNGTGRIDARLRSIRLRCLSANQHAR